MAWGWGRIEKKREQVASQGDHARSKKRVGNNSILMCVYTAIFAASSMFIMFLSLYCGGCYEIFATVIAKLSLLVGIVVLGVYANVSVKAFNQPNTREKLIDEFSWRSAGMSDWFEFLSHVVVCSMVAILTGVLFTAVAISHFK
ncbi:MAG: hypothetical protein A2516_08370 [Alphaproteobacteria bacterium RIFOXYD12_FULL_60_8]|nr:MAG: hypothetical protein A2516_08370 [Alphaproteobacteria bacterium RIFOXYD12_FULL_60_8]